MHLGSNALYLVDSCWADLCCGCPCCCALPLPTRPWPVRLPHADLLANEKGKKREEVKSWTPYPGGAPANVATALTKLGVKTAFVSALGNDEMGDNLIKLLEGGLGVRQSGMLWLRALVGGGVYVWGAKVVVLHISTGQWCDGQWHPPTRGVLERLK